MMAWRGMVGAGTQGGGYWPMAVACMEGGAWRVDRGAVRAVACPAGLVTEAESRAAAPP